MVITKEIYEAAWAKRRVTTSDFRVQLEKDIAVAQSLPSRQQRKAVTEAVDRYQEACKPAVTEWQRALDI